MKKEELLKSWTEEGRDRGASNLIVVCDSFSYEYYPVYVMPGEDVTKKRLEFDEKDMQRVMDVVSIGITDRNTESAIDSFKINPSDDSCNLY